MTNTAAKKALRLAIIIGTILFIAYSLFGGLLNGIIGGFVFGLITFLISKSVIKNNIKFKWWQYIFYIVGWFFAIMPIFWIILYGLYLANNYGEPFFNKNFHRRVYLLGIVMLVFIVIIIAYVYFYHIFG